MLSSKTKRLAKMASTSERPVQALPGRGEPGGACIRRPGAKSTSCRCSDGCVQLTRRHDKQRRHRPPLPIGDGGRRVDAGPVRDHVRAMMVADPSLTTTDIARSAGVSRRSLDMIVASASGRRVLIETAMKVLAVPMPNCEFGARESFAGGRTVCGVGARRMVDALMVAGWPLASIAQRAGVSSSSLAAGNLVSAKASTVEAVAGVYDALRLVPGPRSGGKCRRAGYAPWHVWDSASIHDVGARPDVSMLVEDGDEQWAKGIVARHEHLVGLVEQHRARSARAAQGRAGRRGDGRGVVAA